MCAVGNLNCSQESLTSRSTKDLLRRLSKDHPALHAELARTTEEDEPEMVEPTATGVEEAVYSADAVYDDCDTPLSVSVAVVQGQDPVGDFGVGDDGGIRRAGDVETLEMEAESPVEPALPELGRGKRKKITQTRYSAREWEES
jgi:hypothetical protein